MAHLREIALVFPVSSRFGERVEEAGRAGGRLA